MKLVRTQFRPDGIFGRLYNDHGVPQCYSLEHAFQEADGSWLPKVAVGQYVCVRGMHILEGMAAPFETFEITGVPEFEGKPVSGILFHAGNWDKNSCGCVLVGEKIIVQADGTQMITNSKNTFNDLMFSQTGVKEFMLTIVEEVPNVKPI